MFIRHHQEWRSVSVELLAPAGGMDQLRAAIMGGADAVYLSPGRFTARRFAENFTYEELGDAVRLAHSYGVKVYVTVNTLVPDRNIPDLLDHLLELYSRGVDAFIVQDMGVAKLVSEHFPDVGLHISTQATIHNTGMARFVSEMRPERVILSRELHLDEIASMKKALPGTTFEIFVHGALCYCYSGQCLLSSFIGGRSGNQGACAQPCRKPYRLIHGPGIDTIDSLFDNDVNSAQRGYYLCTRDLNTSHKVGEFIDAGIGSLKIEGRMKNPTFVHTVVSMYREAIDSHLGVETTIPRADHSVTRPYDQLRRVFNRTFTDGYVSGRSGKSIVTHDRPDNQGVFLGTVEHVDHRENTIVIPKGPVEMGDYVEVLEGGRKQRTLEVVDLSRERMYLHLTLRRTDGLQVGDEVRLVRDRSFDDAVASILKRFRPIKRLEVDISAKVNVGAPLELTGTVRQVVSGGDGASTGERDGNDGTPRNVTATVRTDTPVEAAQNRPATSEEMEASLRKVGDTPLEVGTVTMDISGSPFIPQSVLNGLRRELIDTLLTTYHRSHEPGIKAVTARRERIWNRLGLNESTTRPKHGRDQKVGPGLAISISSDRGLDRETLSKVDIIRHSGLNRSIQKGGERIERDLDRILQVLPPERMSLLLDAIDHDVFLDSLREALPHLIKGGLKGYTCSNAGTAALIHEVWKEVGAEGIPIIHGDIHLNVSNGHSARAYGRLFDSIRLSPELTLKDIELWRGGAPGTTTPSGHHMHTELQVYGNIVSMHTKDRIPTTLEEISGETLDGTVHGLVDSKKRTFPIIYDARGNSLILNSTQYCVVDRLSEKGLEHIDVVFADLRFRSPEAVNAIIPLLLRFRDVIARSGWDTSKKALGELESIKDGLKRLSPGGITAGHIK